MFTDILKSPWYWSLHSKTLKLVVKNACFYSVYFYGIIKKAGDTKFYYLLLYYRFEKLCFVLKSYHCQTLIPVESMACNVKWLFVVRLLATSCINASVFVYVAYAGSTFTWSSVLEIKLTIYINPKMPWKQ